jgi:integrase
LGNKVELTKKIIDSLKLDDGETERLVWDSKISGLCIRLRRRADGSTSKVWRVQYRAGSVQRAPNLGSTDQLIVEDARRAAQVLFGKVALGVDPGEESAAAKRAVSASKDTLERVAKLYLAVNKDRWRPSTRHQNEYLLLRQWAPLHGTPIASLDRRALATHLQRLIQEHGRSSASRSRATLAAMFTWAIGEGICDTNPVIATNNPTKGIEGRERTLDDDEIKAVWNACPPDDFGRIVKLLILTGMRREEVGQLRWSEVNLDTGVVSISGERIKNKKRLKLTLPPVAIEILRSAKPADGRVFVFGRDGNRSGFSGWAWGKLDLEKRITDIRGKSLEAFVLHDLRRTMRTGLGRLGVAPHISELAINHVKKGMEKIYDKHDYQPAITAALAAWADHVMAVVEGRERASNVVGLPQRA